MAAQVDDVVDVLDRDGALVYAGAAGHAVPDHLVLDGVGHERGGLEAVAGEHLRPLREDVVAQIHDEQLRRELLAGRVRGADVLAAAALGAGHRVEDPLPGQVRDGARAEAELVVVALEAKRLEPSRRSRPAEEDVRAGRGDVEVLGVGEVDEEGEDDQHVAPDEGAFEHLGRGAPAEEVGERVRDGRPLGRPGVEPQCDLARVPEEEGRDDAGDQAEDEIRLAEVAALEAARPLHLADPERGGDADEHEAAEEVDGEREPALPLEPGERRSRRQIRLAVDHVDRGDDDRGEEDDEAPEDERVHQAGHEALQELLLPEHDDDLVLDTLREVVEALERRAHADEAVEEERPSGEEPEGDGRDRGERNGREQRRARHAPTSPVPCAARR